MTTKHSNRKTTRRAKQTITKKPKQTASKSRQTKAEVIRLAVSKLDTSKYEHERLKTGMGIFSCDEAGNGHFQYVEVLSAYSRLFDAEAGGPYRVVKAWLMSIGESDIVYDALRPFHASYCTAHRREGLALKLERELPKFLERHWRQKTAEDAKKARAEARYVAARLRTHNVFMASLSKHTKALAALAR